MRERGGGKSGKENLGEGDSKEKRQGVAVNLRQRCECKYSWKVLSLSQLLYLETVIRQVCERL